MTIFRAKRHRIYLLPAVTLLMISILYIRSILTVPGEITLLEGEGQILEFQSPFLVNIKVGKDGIFNLNNHDIKVNGNHLRLSNAMVKQHEINGYVHFNLKLFGLIPVKTMRVDVVPFREVVACGSTVGVKLKINGILVIGMSDVETVDGRRVIPAESSGIRPGDLIIEANNKQLNGIEDLVAEIEKSGGGMIKLTYKNGNRLEHALLKPEKATDDYKYHIGLWVRDSTAGIGTLTFYDPRTKSFGALGHGITDIDTGTLMPVENGEILESNILGIKKGKTGMPGELKGVFIEDKNKLGIVMKNSHYGIYGLLNTSALDRLNSRTFPIGLSSQVKEGPAKILSNIDGREVELFDVEIQKISKQNLNGTKGMVIKITDPRLIEATGGIVQGMSGSPIIQDGRIVGAVTHVLVNDPTRGYGIFIEVMLKNLPGGNEVLLEKAG